ncbi:MAG: hypothetical protein RBS56_00310 [Candidatus Gracilibacteria bacterium]|jgi:hypothetical protein|nr:hypothetical protein [Candidatus Gracilibacteria bacterium]
MENFGREQQFKEEPEVMKENIEQRKQRLDSLWLNWEIIKDNPELVALFDRKIQFDFARDVDNILEKNGYPQRTKISELQFETWEPRLNPKFIKDGFIYLLRGDYPNLDEKGFYTRTYGYGKLSTKQLTEQLQSSDEVGYAIYGDERYLTVAKPLSQSIAEELAVKQSQIGGSSFISATTSIPCAEAGTGNVPDAAEQLQYAIYVLKIPIDSVINSNTDNYFGLEEDEYLIPDYVSKNEIIAKYSRDNTEEVYQYLHELLGVSREDVRLQGKT